MIPEIWQQYIVGSWCDPVVIRSSALAINNRKVSLLNFERCGKMTQDESKSWDEAGCRLEAETSTFRQLWRPSYFDVTEVEVVGDGGVVDDEVIVFTVVVFKPIRTPWWGRNTTS